jgi:ankyrin repeat protein
VVAPGHLENLRLCWLISRLLKAGAAVNAKNGFNGTPLLYAASLRLYPCMKVLLQNNADATIMDKFRLTALLFAKHDPHCPKNLRKTMEKSRLQPATSAASTSSNTDLSTHTQDKIELSSQLKKLKFIDLFEVIAPLSDQQRDLLEKLFMNNYKEAAEIIDNLDREQLAILNVFGETLLHILIRTYRGEDKEKFTQCAKLLISKCDSLKQVRLTFQQTPLHSSARSSPFLVELLVKNGADVNATTITGTTPLWSLLDSSNCSDEVRRAAALCLINAGADVDLKAHNGDTLLISTCKKGFFDSAKWLLDNGASTTIVDSNGKSAYDAAFACTMKKCPADLLERLKRR